MIFQLKSVDSTRLADSDTPVSIYLKLRDHFAEALLLEHSEQIAQPGYSYICIEPMAGLLLQDQVLTRTYPDGTTHTEQVGATQNLVATISYYVHSFQTDRADDSFGVNGFFGYFSYNSVRHFENIEISDTSHSEQNIPDIRLQFYRYVIVYNHFRHELTIVHFYTDEQDYAGLENIAQIISSKHHNTHPFRTVSEECANMNDDSFLTMAKKGIAHCLRGDVFQIVLSREFNIRFQGDEFNVYRALRSINPSQYLFYFDYGSYRLFGSSPEAQLRIQNKKAVLHPIAGTYRKTGDAAQDEMLADLLLADPKENAEHVMLVDLARNDLSKSFKNIDIPVFKKVRGYSHVLHMVSEVTGSEPIANLDPVKILADTFPAGTLSGAPKHRAMQLIEKYENDSRGFYGGCVGFMGVDGNCNQAIMIRSFLSKQNTLYYRAGAGIVAASVPENELAEINNKIAALRASIQTASSY